MALASAIVFPTCGIAAQQSTDSAGIRIHDYRQQTSSARAFLVADTPFVRVRAYTPDDTGVFGTTTVALLRNGGLAVGISHNVMLQNRPLTSVGPDGRGTMGSKPALSGPPQAAPARPAPTGAPPTATLDVRLFDAYGRFLRRLGSNGPNLDQFSSSPHSIYESANGELLVSTSQPALSGFKPTGELTRAVRYGNGNRLAYSAGIVADLSNVIGVQRGNANVPIQDPRMILLRNEIRYARHDSTGAVMKELPIVQYYYVFSSAPGRPAAIGSPWPYTARDQVVAAANNIWRFDPIKWELQNFDLQGNLISITRPALPDRLKNAILGGVIEGRTSNATVMVDDEGNLWMDAGVDRNPTPLNFDTQVWAVFGTDGRQLGSVQIPVGMRLHSIQRGALLGSYRESQTSRVMLAGFLFRRVAER